MHLYAASMSWVVYYMLKLVCSRVGASYRFIPHFSVKFFSSLNSTERNLICQPATFVCCVHLLLLEKACVVIFVSSINPKICENYASACVSFGIFLFGNDNCPQTTVVLVGSRHLVFAVVEVPGRNGVITIYTIIIRLTL